MTATSGSDDNDGSLLEGDEAGGDGVYEDEGGEAEGVLSPFNPCNYVVHARINTTRLYYIHSSQKIAFFLDGKFYS
jgi:hypothetical protein